MGIIMLTKHSTATKLLINFCKSIRKRRLVDLVTLGCEKASLLIFVKFFDEPPSTAYEASVKGAPTKPRTAASLLT